MIRVLVFTFGLAGPFIVIASFAWRFGLGFDTPWYPARARLARIRDAAAGCDRTGTKRGWSWSNLPPRRPAFCAIPAPRTAGTSRATWRRNSRRSARESGRPPPAADAEHAFRENGLKRQVRHGAACCELTLAAWDEDERICCRGTGDHVRFLAAHHFEHDRIAVHRRARAQQRVASGVSPYGARKLQPGRYGGSEIASHPEARAVPA